MPRKKKKVAPILIEQKIQQDEEQNSVQEVAKMEKLRGNLDYGRGDFSSAIMRYTKALALSSKNPQLLVSIFTNRAITQLHLKEYRKSIEDCTASLGLDPKYWKACICRAFGNFYLLNFDKTFEDLALASSLVTDNPNLKKKLEKAKESLLLFQTKHEAFLESLKKGKGHQRSQDFSITIDFSTFGLLSIDEEEKRSSETKIEKEKGEFNDLPLLVPIGEVLSDECNTTSYLEPPKKEAEESALKEKELGNNAFAAGNYPIALIHYSKAIRLNWREPVFFSNRALVYLKLSRFHEAITDCTASLDRKPSIKAYARRATAWASLKEYFLAAEDYKRALKFEPRNQDFLGELEKCLVHLEQDYHNKLNADPLNEKLQKSLHNVREDLKKIGGKFNFFKPN